MGVTYIKGQVGGPSGDSETIRFLVDSGATYSLLPLKTWQRLGIKPQRSYDCVLADGTLIEREVGDCSIKLAGQKGYTPVILGEAGDEPLLGIVTLENLGLMLNPLKRTLMPLKIRL